MYILHSELNNFILPSPSPLGAVYHNVCTLRQPSIGFMLVETENTAQSFHLCMYSVWFVFSQPSFGHFNKDAIPDVVIEEDAGNATKRVGTLLCVLNELPMEGDTLF